MGERPNFGQGLAGRAAQVAGSRLVAFAEGDSPVSSEPPQRQREPTWEVCVESEKKMADILQRNSCDSITDKGLART
jgi:hypothetical protein